MPALAVAEAWTAIAPIDVRIFASPGGPAAGLAAQAGHAVEMVPASALARVGLPGRVAALARVARGVPRARARLRAHGSRLVIGTGGYGSGPVLLAARSLGLPTALIEPNAVPGLANRLLRRWVQRAFVSAEAPRAYFGADRAIVTGTPVSPSLAARLAAGRVAPAGEVRVLVMGASRGEHFLGEEMPSFLAAVQARAGPRLRVRHQAGSLDAARLAAAYAQAGVEATIEPFLADVAGALGEADVVVTRGGAVTLAELALAGLPALIVPLADAAEDHQARNAEAHAAHAAALWARETAWSREALAGAFAELIASPTRWQAMSEAARALARPGAAAEVVRHCESWMAGRW